MTMVCVISAGAEEMVWPAASVVRRKTVEENVDCAETVAIRKKKGGD